jgi:hypothetical protein
MCYYVFVLIFRPTRTESVPLTDNDNAFVLLMWVTPSRGSHQMVQDVKLTWKATRKRIRGRREKVAAFWLARKFRAR